MVDTVIILLLVMALLAILIGYFISENIEDL
jgi:uncharacterized protein YneF (UPF0154 family)